MMPTSSFDRMMARVMAFVIALAGLVAVNVATAPPASAAADFVYNTDSPTTNHAVFFTDFNGVTRTLYAGDGSYTRYRITQVKSFRLKSTTCAIVTIRPITGGTYTEYVPKGGTRTLKDGMSIDVDPRTYPC